MGTIFMYVNAFYVFTIDISSYVWAFIYDNTFFPGLVCSIGEGSSKEPCTYNKKIIFLVHILRILFVVFHFVCLLSFVANFYLTAYFTFGQPPSWKKAFGFGGAHLTNYLIHIGLLNLFLRLGFSRPLAPIPVFLIAIPVNFLLVRFVFKQK